MANLATKAPNFTLENASEMGKRGQAARQATLKRRLEEAEREKQAALQAEPKDDEARKQRTLKQIDRLDALIDAALDDDDTKLFLSLSVAKEKLWKLVQPTGGALRPSREKPRRSTPVPQPVASTPQHIDIVAGSGLL